jgi:hypothetical protein
LDKLTEWVVEKFSDIKNQNAAPLKPIEAPLRKDVELAVRIIEEMLFFEKMFNMINVKPLT